MKIIIISISLLLLSNYLSTQIRVVDEVVKNISTQNNNTIGEIKADQ